jgi:hypothetical protein
MTSEQRVEANRQNSLKSTGPRTAAGKAVVALNGIKHGLLSRDAADILCGECKFVVATLHAEPATKFA